MEEMVASKNKYNKAKRGNKKGKRLFQNITIVDYQIYYNDVFAMLILRNQIFKLHVFGFL